MNKPVRGDGSDGKGGSEGRSWGNKEGRRCSSRSSYSSGGPHTHQRRSPPSAPKATLASPPLQRRRLQFSPFQLTSIDQSLAIVNCILGLAIVNCILGLVGKEIEIGKRGKERGKKNPKMQRGWVATKKKEEEWASYWGGGGGAFKTQVPELNLVSFSTALHSSPLVDMNPQSTPQCPSYCPCPSAIDM